MEKHLRIIKLTVLLIAMVLTNQSIEAQTPPNGIEISEGVFIDQTEVSNLDWMEFVYWHKKKYGVDSPKYKATLCDTSVWEEPSMLLYHQHPAYKAYPVVGISYEQAILYCNWRSDRVNEFYYLKENKKVGYETLINSDIEVPQVYKYRLPTKEEWESVAKRKSWFQEKPEDLIETDFEYTEATNWLGFRCICEKVE